MYLLKIKFVGSEAKVQGRFLGFFDVSADRSAESLFEILKDPLSRFGKNKLVAQS
jgi:hypothetical protein